MLSQWLITTGLSCDVVGVALLFAFGLPPSVDRSGSVGLEVRHDPKEAKKGRRYDVYGRFGLGLIIAGFALQIWGVWV